MLVDKQQVRVGDRLGKRGGSLGLTFASLQLQRIGIPQGIEQCRRPDRMRYGSGDTAA